MLGCNWCLYSLIDFDLTISPGPGLEVPCLAEGVRLVQVDNVIDFNDEDNDSDDINVDIDVDVDADVDIDVVA